MDTADRFKMVDPDMDIRRLAKKLFPNLWVHHGVITNIPPAGPMSPARVNDTADRMSEAVLVFSHSLRPVLQYYLEKHSSAMEGSKISFWTHLAFMCLRIRLRRDHLFDYFLNATAVVAECALSRRSRLDEVHAWATTFFCAFFEHELIGPFYSAGGWAGLVNYIQECDLGGVFEQLAPMWSRGATTLVTVASERLSAERRERIASARSLRADEIERFEPAKVLAAKIFHWDFSEKFPLSPLAPGAFRRTPNIRKRKTRSKSESADSHVRLYSIDVEPCAASSAPNLRYMHETRPEGKNRVPTQRSISVDVKAKLSNLNGPYIPLTLQSDLGAGTSPGVEGGNNNDTSSVDEMSEVTSSSDMRSRTSTSLSVFNPICSPKSSFSYMKNESPPRMIPKSLFPFSMEENQTSNENLITMEESQEDSSGVEYAPNNSRYRRFSLPNSNRRTLIDTMQEKNPAIFQTFIFKDDFTLKKSKQTKDQLNGEDNENQIEGQNKSCCSLQKKTFSFEDIHSVYREEPVGKNPKVHQCSHWKTSHESMDSVETDASSNTNLGNFTHICRDDLKTFGTCWENSKVQQCSHWRTSFESMASVDTDTSSNTDLGNFMNQWTGDLMKTETFKKTSKVPQCSHWRTSYESVDSVETNASSNINLGNFKHIWSDDSVKSEADDLGKLVEKLLLTNVTDEPYRSKDNNQVGVSSNTKNDQIYTKSPEMDATTLRSSYDPFEEDTVSMFSSSSSGISENITEYKIPENRHSIVTCSYNSTLSFPSTLKHSEFKSSDYPRTPKKEYGKPLSGKMLAKAKSSPSSSSDKSDLDDKIEKVVLQPDTQTVLYKRRLLGSLAKRGRKGESDNQTETPEKREMDPNFDFQTATKKEKDGKKINDIKQALKNSGVVNPVVFKI